MFLLAATSHDFWLAFLTPRIWKALHMALYVAYGVLVMHVALGVMQDGPAHLHPDPARRLVRAVTLLHIAAAWRERDVAATGRRLARGRPAGLDPRPARPHRRGARTASASRCSATARRSAR